MQIQFNTDESVDGHEALGLQAKGVVERVLSRFSQEVTRVEIHLSDVNAERGGDKDKRCLMEARIAGRQPIAASAQAGSLQLAVEGAAQKLKRSLESALGKRSDHKGKVPLSELGTPPLTDGEDEA